jgi:pimeloyl-ACP methyl ester carboxylesterase
MSITPDPQRLEVPGGTISYQRAGSGPPLLFLHGGGGGGWFKPHASWARHHDVVAPVHPGFGDSDELPEVEAVDDLVYHYLEVIELLGLERPALVGHSFGGWLAAELAVIAPDSFAALVLLGAVGLRIPEAPITDLFFAPPQQLPALLFADPASAPFGGGPPDVETMLAAYRDMTALARFTWSPFMSNPKLHRRLGRVTVPTLVLCAEQDRLVPRAHAERYAQLIDGARLETIAECGHAMHLERPRAVADAVSSFLRDQAGARP